MRATATAPARAGTAGLRSMLPPSEEEQERLLRCVLTSRAAELQAAGSASASDEVKRVLQDPAWLHCFLSSCHGDAMAAAALINSYVSWRVDHRALLASPPAFDALPEREATAPLVHIIDTGSCALAVVNDIRGLSALIDRHGLEATVNAHVHGLERLLATSASARRGIHVVQDLQHMDFWLALKMVDPRLLAVQARAVRFLTSAFPAQWQAVYLVDAPPAFGMIWAAAASFLPEWLAGSVRFLSRPEATAELARIYGRPVLTSPPTSPSPPSLPSPPSSPPSPPSSPPSPEAAAPPEIRRRTRLADTARLLLVRRLCGLSICLLSALDLGLRLLQSALCWASPARAASDASLLTHRPSVLIVGGSFGGLAAQRALCDTAEVDVTVIEPKTFFEYVPGVLRCFVEPSHLRELTTPMPRKRNSLEVATAVGIDTIGSTLTFKRRGGAPAEGDGDTTVSLSYDFLLLATGASYPCAPVRPDLAPGAHMHESPATSDLSSRQREWEAAAASLDGCDEAIVVGGGPVGVELAAEIASSPARRRVLLLTAGGSLCAALPAKVGRLAAEWLEARGVLVRFDARVERLGERGGSVVLEGGEVVGGGRSTVVFDCRGSGRPAVEWLRSSLPASAFDAAGRVVVSDTLQLPSAPRVYAIGDAAATADACKLAHTAELNAHLAARNVMRQHRGEPLLTYPHGAVGADATPQIFAVSLGESQAILAFNGLVLSGSLAAFAKRMIEWSKVACAAERPVGVWIWRVADALTNGLSRIIKPPDRSASARERVRTADGEAVLLFDGVCLLCSGFVHFVIDHDPPTAPPDEPERPPFRFSFATLQSEEGLSFLRAAGLPTDVSTVVLVDEEGAHTRSTAALRVLRHCGRRWAWMYHAFIWVPTPLRDLGYRAIAAARYRVFGRDEGETCRMMSKALRKRFEVRRWEPRTV